MFIQNQLGASDNHRRIILSELEKAEELLFAVAYVKESGVNAILEKFSGKSAKLLCNLDMGITQLSGIKKLLQNDVEVRIYQSKEGTFHPKIWLFGRDGQWKMLIGSANMTEAALMKNVEASILVGEQDTIQPAVTFFYYLWNGENSISIGMEDLELLESKINERIALRKQSLRIDRKREEEDGAKIAILFEYARSWIDIPKLESGGISTLWRGWYIIPDQGEINDKTIEHLRSYLPMIGDGVPMKESNERYAKLLGQFEKNSSFQRGNLKTSLHDLFVRQAKNYLIKLGWCYHPIAENGKPNKRELRLTDLGRQVSQCENLNGVKSLYTDYFLDYTFNGLHIVEFTRRLLRRVDYLPLDEFNYFVNHAYSDSDLELIIELIQIHRSLKNPEEFKNKFVEYFRDIKEPTAKNVYGNYKKSLKHTMSVIGWCNGFSWDDEKLILKLTDEG